MRATLKQLAQFCVVYDCTAEIDGDKMIARVSCAITGQCIGAIWLK